jgi:acetolactate decarboxylase
MKLARGCPLIVLCLALLGLPAWAQPDRDVLYQTSTLDALMLGIYDGPLTFRELAQQGDFGLGTLNGLDGEMIALDGRFYQVTADGVAHEIAADTHTPFAAVTFFDRDQTARIEDEATFADLLGSLEGLLTTTNVFYAIRIDGTFPYVKTRSVPRQQRPYPKLADVIAHQPTFELRDVKGTMVGFRCPAYVKGINVAGYHFHFIDDARSKGGHVLDCRVRDAEVTIDPTRGLRVALPASQAFDRAALAGDAQTDAHVE